MDSELLNNLRKTYDMLLEDEGNEENIKNHIVVELLKMLGYNHSWFHYEKRPVKNKVFYDIEICAENNPNQILLVEVKRKGKRLGTEEITQLSNYMNIKQHCEWGILTNGCQYLLINNSIKGEIDERIVFSYNLLKEKDEAMLRYFTCENIFIKGVTTYFKHLTQYKLYFKQDNLVSSFGSYENTLYNFFSYLAQKKRYIPLDKIRVEDFADYIEFDNVFKKSNNKRQANEYAIANKYAHIDGMFKTLKKKGEIKDNPFEFVLEKMRLQLQRKVKEPIDEKEFQLMLDFYINKNDAERYLALLLLIYTGMDRSEIQYLKNSQMNFEKKIMHIGERVIPLTDHLIEKIYQYNEIKKQQGLTSEYVFPSNYGENKNEELSEGTYNNVVNDSLKQEGITKSRQKEININFIKESLIRKMYDVGFNIEEIAYYTGLSISTIANYFTKEEIEMNIDKKKFLKKHPYGKFFN